FFQAEDGIRDRNVTGVQTCALPICNASLSDAPDRIRQLAEREALQYLLFEIDGVVIPAATTAFWLDSEGLFIFDDSIDEFEQNRSEERRVGKECRYRRE